MRTLGAGSLVLLATLATALLVWKTAHFVGFEWSSAGASDSLPPRSLCGSLVHTQAVGPGVASNHPGRRWLLAGAKGPVGGSRRREIKVLLGVGSYVGNKGRQLPSATAASEAGSSDSVGSQVQQPAGIISSVNSDAQHSSSAGGRRLVEASAPTRWFAVPNTDDQLVGFENLLVSSAGTFTVGLRSATDGVHLRQLRKAMSLEVHELETAYPPELLRPLSQQSQQSQRAAAAAQQASSPLNSAASDSSGSDDGSLGGLVSVASILEAAPLSGCWDRAAVIISGYIPTGYNFQYGHVITSLVRAFSYAVDYGHRLPSCFIFPNMSRNHFSASAEHMVDFISRHTSAKLIFPYVVDNPRRASQVVTKGTARTGNVDTHDWDMPVHISHGVFSPWNERLFVSNSSANMFRTLAYADFGLEPFRRCPSVANITIVQRRDGQGLRRMLNHDKIAERIKSVYKKASVQLVFLGGDATVAEQVATFRTASVIVASHSSQLKNMMYCPPNSVVLEAGVMMWADTLARGSSELSLFYGFSHGHTPDTNGELARSLISARSVNSGSPADSGTVNSVVSGSSGGTAGGNSATYRTRECSLANKRYKYCDYVADEAKLLADLAPLIEAQVAECPHLRYK